MIQKKLQTSKLQVFTSASKIVNLQRSADNKKIVARSAKNFGREDTAVRILTVVAGSAIKCFFKKGNL